MYGIDWLNLRKALTGNPYDGHTLATVVPPAPERVPSVIFGRTLAGDDDIAHRDEQTA